MIKKEKPNYNYDFKKVVINGEKKQALINKMTPFMPYERAERLLVSVIKRRERLPDNIAFSINDESGFDYHFAWDDYQDIIVGRV
jgi:hypothetical protein